MAKICILGDTHFGARNDSPIFDQYFRKFYDEVFFPYLEKNGIKYVIQLGDLFDRRKYINFVTLNNCQRYFFDRLNHNYQTWMIVGNHDVYYKNTNIVNAPSLLLKQYSNITCLHGVYETSFDGVSILMVPWICPENEQRVREDINISKSQICVGHFELAGFEMYKGTVIDHGYDSSFLEKFDMVLSGHYHHRQTKQNITYVGTPYEITWSDYGDVKGFHIFDTSSRSLEFIANPYNMFVKYHYDDLGKSMEDVLLDDFSVYKDTVVKVIVRNKTNPYWFDMVIEKLEKAGAVDIKVVDDHFNKNLENDDDIVNEAEDTLTILNKYVSTMQVQADKKALEHLLRTLYSDALLID